MKFITLIRRMIAPCYPKPLIPLCGFILASALSCGTGLASAPPAERPRLIVLADMGNEPDEEQQMLHLLMCSNEV